MHHIQKMLYQRAGKRILDLTLLAVSAPFVLPVLALVAMAVWSQLGSPILFRQVRTGQGGREFVLYKFRTMTDLRDEHGQLAEDEQRITRIGYFLRSSSLDELPGLWNVVQNDMSLVGPRPLLVEYFPLYSPEQMRRHEVQPGITGWAQVHGRNAITWEEKFQYDVQYTQSVSAWLDLQILVRTVWKVISRQGISADLCATMPVFTGTKAIEEHRDKAA